MINKKGPILDKKDDLNPVIAENQKTTEMVEVPENGAKALANIEELNKIAETKALKEVINTFVLGHQLNKKLKKEQVDMCMQTALSFGLNPLKREIHFVPREIKKKNKQGYWEATGDYDVNIIVGYEVYLKRAEATKRLNGWGVSIEGTGENTKAVITIHKKGWENPFIHEVFMNEARQDRSPVWDKMPRFQLKKVAISQGFRLAFPEELGGMPYIPEEIGLGEIQNGELIDHKQQEKKVIEPPKPKLISAPKAKIMADIFRLKGKSQEPVLDYFKISSLEDLREDQADATLKRLYAFPDVDQNIVPTEIEPAIDPDEAEKGIEEMRKQQEAEGVK